MILTLICSLHESMLAAESQTQSVDFGQSELTDFSENDIFCVG